MPEIASYTALFVSAFLSATLLPGSSEAALVALIASGSGHPVLLIVVATVGNVLGSAVNWAIGRYLVHFRNRRWFPVSPRAYDRAVAWYGHYGLWTLLFSWLPIVGDPLTFAAGVLRTDLRLFIALVTIGKAARYLFVAGALAWWST